MKVKLFFFTFQLCDIAVYLEGSNVQVNCSEDVEPLSQIEELDQITRRCNLKSDQTAMTIWCVTCIAFPFHFLVHLHFSLVSSLLALLKVR